MFLGLRFSRHVALAGTRPGLFWIRYARDRGQLLKGWRMLRWHFKLITVFQASRPLAGLAS